MPRTTRTSESRKSPLSPISLPGNSPLSLGGLRAQNCMSAGEAARPVLCGEHVSAIGQPKGCQRCSGQRKRCRCPALWHLARHWQARLTAARAGRLVSPPYFGLCRHGAPTSVPLERAPLSRGVLHPCSGFPRSPRVRGHGKGTQAFNVPRHGTLVPLAGVRGGRAPHGPPFRPLVAGGLSWSEAGPMGWGPDSPPRLFRHVYVKFTQRTATSPPRAPVWRAPIRP